MKNTQLTHSFIPQIVRAPTMCRHRARHWRESTQQKHTKFCFHLAYGLLMKTISTINKQKCGMSEGGKAQNRAGKEHEVFRVGLKTSVLNWVVSISVPMLVTRGHILKDRRAVVSGKRLQVGGPTAQTPRGRSVPAALTETSAPGL